MLNIAPAAMLPAPLPPPLSAAGEDYSRSRAATIYFPTLHLPGIYFDASMPQPAQARLMLMLQGKGRLMRCGDFLMLGFSINDVRAAHANMRIILQAAMRRVLHYALRLVIRAFSLRAAAISFAALRREYALSLPYACRA